MGLKKSFIQFDNPLATYNPGDVVRGKVEFHFDSPKQLTGIFVELKGEAVTHWTQNERTRTFKLNSNFDGTTFDGYELYFTHKYFIHGGEQNAPIELPAGKHVYPFSIALPNTLPSTFNGAKGYVRYTAKANICRPWKFDLYVMASFTVICPMDCNNDPQTRFSATLSMEKYLSCFCFRQGPINAFLTLPCTGFVVGQEIPYTLEIDNVTRCTINKIRFKLNQKVEYISNTPRFDLQKTETTVAEFVVAEFIAGGENKVYNEKFLVPSVPPSYLEHCNLITINYELKVVTEFDGFHRNMVGIIPIIIGTIPLRNIQWNLETCEDAESALIFSAEPETCLEMFNLRRSPPPTYDECHYAREIFTVEIVGLPVANSGYTSDPAVVGPAVNDSTTTDPAVTDAAAKSAVAPDI